MSPFWRQEGRGTSRRRVILNNYSIKASNSVQMPLITSAAKKLCPCLLSGLGMHYSIRLAAVVSLCWGQRPLLRKLTLCISTNILPAFFFLGGVAGSPNTVKFTQSPPRLSLSGKNRRFHRGFGARSK